MSIIRTNKKADETKCKNGSYISVIAIDKHYVGLCVKLK